jgi:hypothetical protein
LLLPNSTNHENLVNPVYKQKSRSPDRLVCGKAELLSPHRGEPSGRCRHLATKVAVEAEKQAKPTRLRGKAGNGDSAVAIVAGLSANHFVHPDFTG